VVYIVNGKRIKDYSEKDEEIRSESKK
jgi:hypothetical protein